MAVNSSTHLAPPPHRLLPRSSFAFFSRIFLRPVSAAGFPTRTLVSVRARSPSADGAFGSKQPLGLDESTGSPSSSSVIDFLTLCHRLKTTKRRGWINHGINGPESIADHMYRMALMSLIAGDLPGVNRERCIKIALVHDIAEAIVGDITPSDGVPKEEKSRREAAALNEMCELLGGAEEIKELWAEYENNSSLEANLVKDFDKVELILQAFEYEIEHGKELDEFFLSTAGKFQTDVGKRWAAEVLSRRNSRLSN
ncbi:HD domain-containing protein C4G3.17 isoform X2 [Momordica charantia]|uniref:5'-deoxynucleotidase n=1 Tax=Momordica charantia TaxID=3673 RepID=A0A6J1CXT1_MOMCH|nr:HD domain-containing protein C4G3.17 isoform X2 [Momordica charantia]